MCVFSHALLTNMIKATRAQRGEHKSVSMARDQKTHNFGRASDFSTESKRLGYAPHQRYTPGESDGFQTSQKTYNMKPKKCGQTTKYQSSLHTEHTKKKHRCLQVSSAAYYCTPYLNMKPARTTVHKLYSPAGLVPG